MIIKQVRSKPIDVIYHRLCNVVEETLMHFKKFHTDWNGFVMMIQYLPTKKCKTCRYKAKFVMAPQGENCRVFFTQVNQQLSKEL